jgi:hypothetical protein
MAKRDEIYGTGKYLKAADLDGTPLVLKIKATEVKEMKDFNGQPAKKLIVYFGRKAKPLIVNRTNFDSIMDVLGEDTEDWLGGEIEVYGTTTDVNSKNVDCIRVRAPSSRSNKKKPPSAADPDLDDEIPFQ